VGELAESVKSRPLPILKIKGEMVMICQYRPSFYPGAMSAIALAKRTNKTRTAIRPAVIPDARHMLATSKASMNNLQATTDIMNGRMSIPDLVALCPLA
jgi:hypothetical protein